MRVLRVIAPLLFLALSVTSTAKKIYFPAIDSAQWTSLGVTTPAHPVSLTIILRGEKSAELEGRMMQIAQTRSKWLTSKELEYYTKPSRTAQEAVLASLHSHGVDQKSISFNRAGNVVSVSASAEQVSDIFSTRLHLVQNKITGQVKTQASGLLIPSNIAEHVVDVEGLYVLPSPRAALKLAMEPAHHPHVGSDCSSVNVSWHCVRKYYSIDTYTPQSNSESIAVINYDLWKDQTILNFERNLYPVATGYIPHKGYLGSSAGKEWDNITEEGVEATVDAEVLIAMAWPLNLTAFYSTTYRYAADIRALIELPDSDRPGIVSYSYGSTEEDVPLEASLSFCQAVQQLTALGTTFFAASGDNGVMPFDPERQCPPFLASTAPACPYVVAVGATMGFDPEIAVSYNDTPGSKQGWGTSGFSRRFEAPAYQKTVIQDYLTKTGLANTDYFNTSGRAYNDLSAIGLNSSFWISNEFEVRAGQSISSPVVASIFALINSKCKEQGQPRVGWIHPIIYDHPEAFNDVTQGGSYGCNTTDLGFPCGDGWDPPTGLGSPRFDRLVDVFGCG